MLFVAVSRSSAEINATRYVLPALWMTSHNGVYVVSDESHNRGMSASGRQLNRAQLQRLSSARLCVASR